MKSEYLETPRCMIMGCHYTKQFSRRTRVNVMGLVNHATEEWVNWYLYTHELEAVKKIAEAGYNFMEIHFLYGFGLKYEKEEVELTKKIVANAHKCGIKVLGYFQFFSVQEELFFLENPWAKKCLQLKSDGTHHQYHYDRPALCFSYDKVKKYYLDGVELGLNYCDLDGIRLDNDYYKGCYCDKCQEEFKKYLKAKFNLEKAAMVFGLPTLAGCNLVPQEIPRDPLWQETVKFRQQQRQRIMKLISDKILSIKPNGILGGNPAVSRDPDEAVTIHLYPPDLGETHHLVCAENSLFPARTGNSIRHQVLIYKYGQSNDFKVFPSHHLYIENGGVRWPENEDECALSMCESLCFGGHSASATWGLRMDNNSQQTLYQRPHFLEVSRNLRAFIDKNEAIYSGAKSNTDVGIYINRESLIATYKDSWYSLQGLMQILLMNKVVFRFVDRDSDSKLKDLNLVIIPDMRLVSSPQIKRFNDFLNKDGKIILTGESCQYDEYFLERNDEDLKELMTSRNLVRIDGTPEKLKEEEVKSYGENCHFDYPEQADIFLESLYKIYDPVIKIKGSKFVAIDTFLKNNTEFVHLINYDNKNSAELELLINKNIRDIEILSPDKYGVVKEPDIVAGKGKTQIRLKLNTYAVIRFKSLNKKL